MTGISLEGDKKVVHTQKEKIYGKTVILAAGAVHRKLAVPGEESLPEGASLIVLLVTEHFSGI